MNKKAIGIIVIVLLGGIGAFFIYQNQNGGLFKGTLRTSMVNWPSTVTLIPRAPLYIPHRYEIRVTDANNLREFSITTQSGAPVHSHAPFDCSNPLPSGSGSGSAGSGAGSGSGGPARTRPSITSGTIFHFDTSDFPLNASVIDCRSTTANTFTVIEPPPPVLPTPIDTDSTVTVTPQSTPGRYDITVGDPDGILNFGIDQQGETDDESFIAGGSPGAPGNLHACSDAKARFTTQSVAGWIDNFPLMVGITDCQSGAGPQVHTIPSP